MQVKLRANQRKRMEEWKDREVKNMNNKEIINLASIIGYMYDYTLYPGAGTYLSLVFDYDNEKARLSTNEFMGVSEIGYMVDKEVSPNLCQLLIGSFAINEAIERKDIIPGTWIEDRNLIDADSILKDNNYKDYEITDIEALGAYYTAFASFSNVHDGRERKPITAILTYDKEFESASFKAIYTEDDLINYLNDYTNIDEVKGVIESVKENIDDFASYNKKEELEEKIETWEKYYEQIKSFNKDNGRDR